MRNNLFKGSALLSALFIMTMVAIAATAMSTRLQLDIYRTSLTHTSDKLYLASQAATFWAMDILSDKKNKFTISETNGKLVNFPAQLKNIYPEVSIKGSLYDLQARFNLNNLADKKFHPFFLTFLSKKGASNNSEEGKALLKAVQHWISAYQPGRGQDEFLSFYQKQSPAYLPSFQPMTSVSEFRLIKGVNGHLYQELLPFVIALPEKTAININAAPKKILASLGNGLTEYQLNELIEARGEQGITDIKDINLLLEKLDIPKEHITIESQYFLIVATVSTSDLILNSHTIIKRHKDEKGKLSTSIIYENLNTL